MPYRLLQGCTICFGIPTSRSAFDADLGRTEEGYARQFPGGWPQYLHSVIKAIDRVEAFLQRWGVGVVRELSLADLAGLFHRGAAVIVLFSHWRCDGQVEFADGFANPAEIIEQIPPDYRGILDLCVCHPGALVEALQRDRRGVIIRWLPTKAQPTFWIHFYWLIFQRMRNTGRDYLDAFADVVEQIQRDKRLHLNRGPEQLAHGQPTESNCRQPGN